jgi:hypothetical protein
MTGGRLHARPTAWERAAYLIEINNENKNKELQIPIFKIRELAVLICVWRCWIKSEKGLLRESTHPIMGTLIIWNFKPYARSIP